MGGVDCSSITHCCLSTLRARSSFLFFPLNFAILIRLWNYKIRIQEALIGFYPRIDRCFVFASPSVAAMSQRQLLVHRANLRMPRLTPPIKARVVYCGTNLIGMTEPLPHPYTELTMRDDGQPPFRGTLPRLETGSIRRTEYLKIFTISALIVLGPDAFTDCTRRTVHLKSHDLESRRVLGVPDHKTTPQVHGFIEYSLEMIAEVRLDVSLHREDEEGKVVANIVDPFEVQWFEDIAETSGEHASVQNEEEPGDGEEDAGPPRKRARE